MLFVYLDISWAIEVITIAVSATGKAYVLSYGQVRLPFCDIDSQPLISREYLLFRCFSYFLLSPLLHRQSNLFIPIVVTFSDSLKGSQSYFWTR